MRILPARFFLICTIILILGVFSVSFYMFTARASVSKFYATTCLGGWENTHLASGAPEVADSSGLSVFTEANSARLNMGTLAQIYCGGFTGDISENTIPKKILVKFSWAVKYPELASEDTGVLEVGSATSTGTVLGETEAAIIAEESLEEEIAESNYNPEPEKETAAPIEEIVSKEDEALAEDPVVAPEEKNTSPAEVSASPLVPSEAEEGPISEPAPLVPSEAGEEPEPAPAPEEPTASLFNFFAKVVRAQELSIEEVATSSEPTEIATTTTGNTIIVPSIAYGLAEVLYTLNGIEWKSLGFVEKDEFNSKYFEIPIEEASAWEDISKIQIAIQSVPVLDDVVPTIYLDSVWIEAEYGFLEYRSSLEEEALDEVAIVEEVAEEEEIIEEILEVNENPVSNESNLKTRTFNDFVIDKDANHHCSSEEFAISLVEGSTIKHKIQIFGFTIGQEAEMIIGSLPRGIDVYFSKNKNYRILLSRDEVEVELSMQAGAQIGNFTIPIIYSLKNDDGYSSVVCQINIVNL